MQLNIYQIAENRRHYRRLWDARATLSSEAATRLIMKFRPFTADSPVTLA